MSDSCLAHVVTWFVYSQSLDRWKEVEKVLGRFSDGVAEYDTSAVEKEIWSRVWPLAADVTEGLRVTTSEDKMAVSVTGNKRLVTKFEQRWASLVDDARDQVQEERDTKKETVAVKDFEMVYMKEFVRLDDLKARHRLKEVQLSDDGVTITLLGHFRSVAASKKEITALCGNMKKLEKVKGPMYVDMCKKADVSRKIATKLGDAKVKAICNASGSVVTVYACSKQAAEEAMKCVEEVVWEAKYPEDREFDKDEKDLVVNDKRKWLEERKKIVEAFPPLKIVENTDSTQLVMTGSGVENKPLVLKRIDEFFEEAIDVSQTFHGDHQYFVYMERHMQGQLDDLATKHNVKVSMADDGVNLVGKRRNIQLASEEVKQLYDGIMKDENVIKRQHHANLVMREPEILEDIGRACKTLIINKNMPSSYQAENTALASKTLPYQAQLVSGCLEVSQVGHRPPL